MEFVPFVQELDGDVFCIAILADEYVNTGDTGDKDKDIRYRCDHEVRVTINMRAFVEGQLGMALGEQGVTYQR